MREERTCSSKYRKHLVKLGVLALAVLLLTGCGGRLRPATTTLLDDAESRWQDHPVMDYHLVAQVDRPGDVRRVEVLVEHGRVLQATMRYREKGRWGDATVLSENQAQAFTVPGLFEMVRGELASSWRNRIQIELDGTFSFPRRLVLGPVYQDGGAVPDTKAVMIVRRFEPLEVQK